MLTESSEVALHTIKCVNTLGQRDPGFHPKLADAMQLSHSTFKDTFGTAVSTENGREPGFYFLYFPFYSRFLRG